MRVAAAGSSRSTRQPIWRRSATMSMHRRSIAARRQLMKGWWARVASTSASTRSPSSSSSRPQQAGHIQESSSAVAQTGANGGENTRSQAPQRRKPLER